MALLAARESRRLEGAQAMQEAIKPLRVVYASEPSIILLGRRAPYTLDELRSLFPDALTAEGDGVWLLREHVVVGPGARLVVASPEVRELRLLSTSTRFVTIAGWTADIDLHGAAGSPLRITSWDPATVAPDRERTDGRAYILAKGGRMDAADAHFSNLGFAIGESSGVAWRGWPGVPSHGSVSRSSFVGNLFGAYTFEAVDMAWTDNLFAANVGYGFDPHDHSDRFVVTGNVAIGNGSHGMVFSRGCTANVIRHNMSALNGGSGFVLDDGRVALDGNPRHARADPSDYNFVQGNVALGNKAGIALEGASHNVVRGNLVAANRVGLRLKDASNMNALAGNMIASSSVFGIQVYARSIDNTVMGNGIFSGKAGIVVSDSTGNHLDRNAIGGITGRGIVLTGDQADTSVTANTIDGRGSAAIDARDARGMSDDAVIGNPILGWTEARTSPESHTAGRLLAHHPAIGIWLVVLLVPFAWWLPARRRRFVRRLRRSSAATGAP
jgi:parallel beta-helix repeat protein